MTELFVFLRELIDRTWLWFSISIISFICYGLFRLGIVILQNSAEYVLLTGSLSLALAIQTSGVRSRLRAISRRIRIKRHQMRHQQGIVQRITSIPCKELTLVVAYIELLESGIKQSSDLPHDLLRNFFWNADDSPTQASINLVNFGLAVLNHGVPRSALVHDWLERSVRIQLRSPQATQAKRCRTLLMKHGSRFYKTTEWQKMFVHSRHEKAIKALESE